MTQPTPAPFDSLAGPRSAWSALTTLRRIGRERIGVLSELSQHYGPFFRFRIGTIQALGCLDPDAIREVLVTKQGSFEKGVALKKAKVLLGNGLLTSEGEFHLRQRRLAQPAFHRQRISSYASTMVSHTERMLASWHDGETRDVEVEMMALTMSIVAKTLFDADLESKSNEIGEALADVLKMFQYVANPLSQLMLKLPLPSSRRFWKAKGRLDTIVEQMIRTRREKLEDRGDLLSMLMLARDEEGDGQGMSDAQLRDEALTIFLAGHETTANALMWTFYALSQNPQVEQKLHREIDTVLQGRAPTAEDYPRLPYTTQIVSESLRLYPPAYLLGRLAVKDVEIAGTLIPAGTAVLIAPYLVHRNPAHFPNPEAFDPDRWTAEAKAARHRFAYFPFAAGTRQCIGEGFAWMEAVLLLATIAQRFRLVHDPTHTIELEQLITLRSKFGMRMKLESRAPQLS